MDKKVTDTSALHSTVGVARDDAVAIVTLQRPHKRNALDDATVEALEATFRGFGADVKAIVLQGDGDHFCAGLDLSEIEERDTIAGIAHSRLWHQAFEQIQFGRAPVVAVLHGAVVGGGLELAAATHVRVAERSAFYALPEGQRGIFVGGGGSVRIPRLVGTPRMMDMMLTGRTYSAEEGAPLGFSQYVVDTGRGREKALELAHRIAANTPMTNFAVVHALPRIAESDPAAGLLTEALMSSVAQASPEAKRRLTDFLNKRGPKVTRRD
jgi:enoyl-CoA hydratase/carnithine racemase